jgi:hypothetical protein
MAEIHFWLIKVLQTESDVTNQLRFAALVSHFVRISYLSFAVQKLFNNFMPVQC